jgi:hypothetical protein
MLDMHRRRDDPPPNPADNVDLERQMAALALAVQRLEVTVSERYQDSNPLHYTVLRDVGMPFGSMVILAIKWMFAYLVASIFVVGLPLLIMLGLGLLGVGLRLGR